MGASNYPKTCVKSPENNKSGEPRFWVFLFFAYKVRWPFLCFHYYIPMNVSMPKLIILAKR